MAIEGASWPRSSGPEGWRDGTGRDAGPDRSGSGGLNAPPLATVGLTVVTLLTFEAAHPGVKVVLNFAGSSAHAQQINQDAPAEFFASAATKNMDQVTDKRAATTFVKADWRSRSPGWPTSAMPTRRALLPTGALRRRGEGDLRGRQDHRQAAQSGAGRESRADQGQPQRSRRCTGLQDRRTGSRRQVDGIECPEADKAINEYPIATLTKAPNASGAKAFVDMSCPEKAAPS